MSACVVSFADIAAAHERIRPAAHHTPVMTSVTANAHTGAQLYFKCENLQRTGAFKFRGAYNALARLTPEQRAQGVITYSPGNHAQAIALTARLMGMRAVIVMPTDAPAAKKAATQGYGAEIVLYDRYKDDREAIAKERAEQHGFILIPPYDHADIIAGQGTVGKEFLEDAGRLDVLLVPVGGGGLLAGCALAAKTLHPSCRVIGVEPEMGNDAQQSLRSGAIVRIPTPKTIADGAQTQQLGAYTFPMIQRYVDDIVTVSDAQLVDTMAFCAGRMKIVVEPTGCLAAAAVLHHCVNAPDKRVGIVVSGGNITLTRFAELIAGIPP